MLRTTQDADVQPMWKAQRRKWNKLVENGARREKEQVANVADARVKSKEIREG